VRVGGTSERIAQLSNARHAARLSLLSHRRVLARRDENAPNVLKSDYTVCSIILEHSTGIDPVVRGFVPLKICRRVRVCFDAPPLKCHILSFKTVVG